MSLISIIVPVYNTEQYLQRCIDSLLLQEDVQFEIIIVDDGSTDSSAAICRKYADKNPGRIRLIENRHGGVSMARNTALDAAKGEWIYFVDSDDRIEPFACKTLLNLAESTNSGMACARLICDASKHTDIRSNFPGTGNEVWDRKSVLQRAVKPFFRLEETDRGLAKGYLPLSLLKRSIIEQYKIRFITGLAIAEDEAFFLNYLQYIDRIAFSDQIIYHYIASPGSACDIHFKKKRSLADMEKHWSLLSANRWNIYRGGISEQAFPSIRLELCLAAAYHGLMSCMGNPALSGKEKRAAIARLRHDTIRDIRATTAKQDAISFKYKLFRTVLFCGCLPLFLFAKLILTINK